MCKKQLISQECLGSVVSVCLFNMNCTLKTVKCLYDINFCFDFLSSILVFQVLFCYILERKDKKWFKRDIIVLISFLILFVSISFLVNIGKEMSLPGFRTFNSITSILSSATKNYM